MEMRKEGTPGGVDEPVARLLGPAGECGEADWYAGKRRSTRFTEGMHVEVTTDPAQPAVQWGVYLHNVSGGGFAFWSRKEVPARSTVHVRECGEDGPGPWLRARVTHCTRGIRGFLIGAAFVGS